MRIKHISTIEQWETLSSEIHEKGYSMWQNQYGSDSQEGFHARFLKEDKTVEVVTFSKDVQGMIIAINDKR